MLNIDSDILPIIYAANIQIWTKLEFLNKPNKYKDFTNLFIIIYSVIGIEQMVTTVLNNLIIANDV